MLVDCQTPEAENGLARTAARFVDRTVSPFDFFVGTIIVVSRRFCCLKGSFGSKSLWRQMGANLSWRHKESMGDIEWIGMKPQGATQMAVLGYVGTLTRLCLLLRFLRQLFFPGQTPGKDGRGGRGCRHDEVGIGAEVLKKEAK